MQAFLDFRIALCCLKVGSLVIIFAEGANRCDIKRKLATKGNLSQSWILDSKPWIPDSKYWIPVFVSGTWILESSRQWDSGFLELCSGFQSTGFQISRIPESEFSYMGRGKEKVEIKTDLKRPRD